MVAEDKGESVYLLAGDIGGTNSRFIAFKVAVSQETFSRGPREHPEFERVYAANFKNENYGRFKDVMQVFFEQAEEQFKVETGFMKNWSACCLAVAGPVDEGGRANFTNRGWVIEPNQIKSWFGFDHVTVVNDFVASGYGILTLQEGETRVLQEGKFSEVAPIAVLGAGTGLGECFLAPSPIYGTSFFDAYPTEGGHVEFAPKTPVQFRCLQFLQKKFQGRVSVERIVSGKGLVNVYEFFKDENPEEVKEHHDEKINSSEEAGAVIANLAYDYTLCQMTMDFVFEVYGTEAGSVALKYLPYGGLYVCGSLAPRNIERLSEQNSAFMRAALDKGRVSPALQNIPIQVVMCEDLGMRGAQLLAYKSYLEANRVPLDQDVFRSGGLQNVQKDQISYGPAPREKIPVHYVSRSMDLTFVTEIAVASSVAASIALLFGFGARTIAKYSP